MEIYSAGRPPGNQSGRQKVGKSTFWQFNNNERRKNASLRKFIKITWRKDKNSLLNIIEYIIFILYYIYFQLLSVADPNAEWDPRQRIEILRIRSDGNGHFWFKPDLSGGRPPYRISQETLENFKNVHF